MTLIHQRIYNSLKYRNPLKQTNIALQSANGSSLNAIGTTEIEFKLGGLKLSHEFVVVSDLNRSTIIGRDFLVKHGVRLYFDLMKLRINDTVEFRQ